MTGEKHGRLVVVSRAENRVKPSGQKRTFWNCRCECGSDVAVASDFLKRGLTKSCGCYNRDAARSRRLTHGQSRTDTYNVWNTMHSRCENPKVQNYPRYGGRGIKVCERWASYVNFIADMGERPEGGTIERKNNDGNYEPGNCVWATVKCQQNNRSTNVLISALGKTQTIQQWAEELQINPGTIAWRIRNGCEGQGVVGHGVW